MKETIDPYKKLADEMVKEFSSIDNIVFLILKDDILLNIAKKCALICLAREKKAVFNAIESVSDFIPEDILSQQAIFKQIDYTKVREEILIKSYDKND